MQKSAQYKFAAWKIKWLAGVKLNGPHAPGRFNWGGWKMQLMSAARQGRKVSGKRWRDAEADRRTELSQRQWTCPSLDHFQFAVDCGSWCVGSCCSEKLRFARSAVEHRQPTTPKRRRNPRPTWKSAPFYWPLSSSPLPVSTQINFFPKKDKC